MKEVASLSLVSSACDVVSAAYASTKESHPYLRSVCDAAEKGVQSVTEATASCVQPVLVTLEPHGNPLGKGRPLPGRDSLAPSTPGRSPGVRKCTSPSSQRKDNSWLLNKAEAEP